jgi:hypothetical protein
VATIDDAETELRLLTAQLDRMRGMLFGYSDLFFRRIRDWSLVAIVLLVLGAGDIVPHATWILPFLVPFAFLETGYLFWYTVFARRYAERVERRINAMLGSDVLIAHRLEAAYFYPPDAPKVAALSTGNPLGMMSAATLGYTGGAGLLWGAGFLDLMGNGPRLLILAAVAWTAAIAAYLVWSSLTRRDEVRLLAELDRWQESRRPSATDGRS